MNRARLLRLFLSLLLVEELVGFGWVRDAGAASSVLSTSDISCAGVFLTPGVQTGSFTPAHPMAFRYESDGKRHYFMLDGTGHVVEFPEPTLSPCNTPLTAVNRATLENWGGDWGRFNVSAGANYVPGQSSAFAYGMYYDDALSQLLLSWTNTYVYAGTHNTFAGATLEDATHTLNVRGCWAVTGQTMPIVGSGVLNIPSSFVSANLPAGARYGVGFGGGIASVTGGISYGPSLIALPPPSPNACVPATDNLVGSGTVLSQYPTNNNGPTCSVLGLGCTPTQAPTVPYPAKLAVTNYSKRMYTPDWDPYGGNGWFGFGTSFSMGWYDDGTKGGVVVPVSAPEGWANATILANPPPTLEHTGFYPTGTMYLDSTSTHDGLTMNPGDLIWVETCLPGVDPNCDTANARHLSFAYIDSIDTSTGRVAFHIVDPDFGTGNHRPVVGGPVYLGCLYAHGAPACSRQTYRLQIYDPAQYAQVSAGLRQPYDVSYKEDIDLNTMVTGFGGPERGGGINQSQSPTSTMTDSSAHQIMISFTHANNPGGQESNAVYVFNVAAPGSPTARLTASPSRVSPGGSSTLTWFTSGATGISITPDIGLVPASGSVVVAPSVTTTYMLTATNAIGTVTSLVGVIVAAPGSYTSVQADFSGLRVFPNPWRSDRYATQAITFDHLPLGSTVKIFTTSGHWVANAALTADPTIAVWPLTNDKGNKVASGIYVYLIKVAEGGSYGGSGGKRTTGQIVVVR